MKKSIPIFLFFVLALSFQNCSSVKVMDSWKSDNISSLKDNNFLVFTRTENKQARITLENEIVKQMTAKGYKATASFQKFPGFDPSKKMSEGERNQLRELIEGKGYNGVVLTILKDYQEETRIETEGGGYAGGTYYGYYPRYYGGFYGYYNNPYSYRTMGNYVEQTSTEYTAKLYILETTIYDLEAEGEQQLKAIVTSKLDNPESASAIAKDYVKKVSNSLK